MNLQIISKSCLQLFHIFRSLEMLYDDCVIGKVPTSPGLVVYLLRLCVLLLLVATIDKN